MIWAPPLLHQKHPVMRLVSLPLASAHPTPLPQTVQQAPPSSRRAMAQSMDGGSKQKDSSWGEQLPDLQASLEKVICNNRQSLYDEICHFEH